MHDLAKTFIIAQAIGGDTPAPTPTVTKGLVFSEYDSNGYPHKVEFVGSWTSIPTRFLCGQTNADSVYNKYITELVIPEGVTSIGGYAFAYMRALTSVTLPSTLAAIAFGGGREFQYCSGLTSITIPSGVKQISNETFYSCTALKTVYFLGNITKINGSFRGNTETELYDFSHNTSIPTLSNVASLGHKSGCVIKIPSALSDTTLGTGNGWESKTNWAALTDVVWEVV